MRSSADILAKKKAENPGLASLMYLKSKGKFTREYFRQADLKRYWTTGRRELQQAYQKDYRKLNKDKTAHWTMLRHGRKLRATPKWLSADQIEEIAKFYSHARDCAVISGDKYEVDHIIPLKGKDVCGLHVPWNLQILPADINRRKSNNY